MPGNKDLESDVRGYSLTGYALNSAMEAVYRGYCGMGMMTPDCLSWPIQVKSNVFIPLLAPDTRYTRSQSHGISSRWEMNSATCFRMIDIPRESE